MTPMFGSRGGGSVQGFGRRHRSFAPGPPPAPTSLSISSNSVGFSEPNVVASIGLSWTNTDASAQTRIYRNGSLYDTVSAGVSSYSLDESLGASLSYTVYHYKNNLESATGSSTSGTAASYGTVTIFHGATSFNTPSTWNNSNNSIECIGGGQGGQPAFACIYGGYGGEGGGYAARLNQSLSGTYTVSVGTGSVGASGMWQTASPGGDTTFSGPNTIRARGGNSSTTQLGTYTSQGGGSNAGNNWAMGGSGGGGAAYYTGYGGQGPGGNGGCSNPSYLIGASGGSGGALYATGNSGNGGTGGYGNGSNGGSGQFPGGGGGGGGGSGQTDDAHGGPGCCCASQIFVDPCNYGGDGGNGAIYITWGA